MNETYWAVFTKTGICVTTISLTKEGAIGKLLKGSGNIFRWEGLEKLGYTCCEITIQKCEV